jgi:hypothetical protein
MSIEEARARFVHRELRRYRIAVLAGRYEAIGDALAFCARWGTSLPLWLEAARRKAIPKRGRGRPPADETDYLRWDMVQECRTRRGDVGIPLTWAATYSYVSDALRGTPHWGSAETIAASYKRVIKRMRANPGRYYIRDL